MSRSTIPTLLTLAIALILPLVARADDDDRRCAQTEPRNLQLDLGGVDTVVFDTGANDVDVRAAAGASGKVQGRACASEQALLDALVLSQQKSGAKLVVRAERRDSAGSWSDNRYAYMTLRADVPETVMVQLKVGSGDVSLEGARAASADVGSGDVRIARVRGQLTVATGSGDVDADDIGALDVLSVGSGDVKVRHVRGAAKVGNVGSGDVGIRGTQGPVEIGSVGSGDIDLAEIGGSVTVGSVGSGDLTINGVRGDLSVRSMGSGDIDHQGVSGRVDLPRKR